MRDTPDHDAVNFTDRKVSGQSADAADDGDSILSDDEIAALAAAACDLTPAVEWAGREIKFPYKTGVWFDSKEAEQVGSDELFVIDARSFTELWKRIGRLPGESKRTVTDLIGGRRIDGWLNPIRDTMPETDDGRWSRNDKGLLEDPWSEEARLVLRRRSDGQLFTWCARYSDRFGMGDLLDSFAREAKDHPGCMPVVTLGRTPKGENFRPLLSIVSWESFGPGASPPANPLRLKRLQEDLAKLRAKYEPKIIAMTKMTKATKGKAERGVPSNDMNDEIPF